MRQLDNWLNSYMEYLKDVEAPNTFKFWSAITCISAALKRNVFIKRGTYLVMPNTYVILVGPPGKGKGTCIDVAKTILNDAHAANIIKDKVTAEKVVERIQTGWPLTPTSLQGLTKLTVERSALLIAPELKIYLNSSSWTLEFMCEMWDRHEWDYDTKTKGTYKLTEICTSMIGGCVADYVRSLSVDSPSTTVSGGFASRCIFVNEQPFKRKAFPDDMDDVLRQNLVDDLNEIGKIHGEFHFTQEARDYFTHHYAGMSSNDFESDVVSGFKARMLVHIWKLAMFLTVADSKTAGGLMIELDKLKHAITYTEEICSQLDLIFRGVGDSDIVVQQDRIIRYMQLKRTATYGQILHDNLRHVSPEILSRVLSVLTSTTPPYVTTMSIAGNKTLYTWNSAIDARLKKPQTGGKIS